MPGPAFARGDTVSLHPIEDEDYEFLQRGRNHPSTRVPLTNPTIRRREDVADRIEDADDHYLICADGAGDSASTDAERDPVPVGVIAFTRFSQRPPRSAVLMYWIAPDRRGNGHATAAADLFLDYAFRERGVHKVVAQTLASNDASVAVLESLGFEREGRLVDEEFVDGESVDVFRYGLLADWRPK